MRVICVILVCFGLSCIPLSDASGQDVNDPWKVHLQVVSSFGYPENTVGFRIVGEYKVGEEAELALAYGLSYNFRSYGPNIRHLEHSIMGTAHYVWGDEMSDPDEEDLSYIKFLDSRSYQNSFGYTWQRFFNRIGTSQNVGTIHMRFNKTVTQFSNDVFANTNGKDRYRTGGFAFGFYENKTLYMSKLLIWTGDSHCKEMKKIRETDYPARWGFRDITDCNYGKLSHGILSFGVTKDIGYGQTVGGNLGIDSESIRHLIQNKVFHDLYFVPRFMNKTKNLHLPMKTENGENFLFQDGQKVRKNRLVWQFSLNPTTLY